jgi:hypothetical protein
MRDVPVGEKLKDEQTGGPALFVGECTWNFVNDGASTNYYRFNANDGALFGSSPK